MLDLEFSINGRSIGVDAKPYIIAEIGSNFDQSLDLAKQLIDESAAAGADAVKFQLFQAKEMYPEGTELYDIFKSIELCPDWLATLKDHADGCGVHFLASPFDTLSVDRLVEVGVPAMKIASSETTKLGFVEYVAAQKVPVMMATGMCDLIDVIEAVNACKRGNNTAVALLQCGTRYPLPSYQANLRVMERFQDIFGGPVGLSDHTEGQVTAIAAVARGASVIEKHVTLDRNSKGPDHFYAMETKELGPFIRALHEAQAALGNGEKEMLVEEKEAGRREGLHAARDLKVGEIISADDLVVRRPAAGVRARYFETIIGAKVKHNITCDQPVLWDDITPAA